MNASRDPAHRPTTKKPKTAEIDCATCELFSGREAAEFRLAVDHAHEGLALTDAEGRYLYLNLEHARLFGYESPDELLGRSWRTLYADEVSEHLEDKALPLLHTQGHWHGIVQARRKDGSTFCQSLTLSLLPGGRLVCNCRDCSEELANKRKLDERDQLLSEFLNNLPIGVLIRRSGGSYEFLNDEVARFAGQGKAELIGTDRPPLLPEKLVHDLRAVDEQVCTTRAKRDFEVLIPRGDSSLTYRVIKFPLYGSEQAPTHICTVVQDITAEKRLAAEQNALSRQRQDIIEMQRQFISMVSHEFRTPLTAIQGAHYLLGKRAGQLPEQNERELKRILAMQQQSVSALRELVDQVLLINRLEHQSGAPAETTAVDLPALVSKIAGTFNDVVSVGRVRVDLQVPPGWQVPASEPLLRSAFENLVSNALKYSPAEEAVLVNLAATDESWQLSVTDRGRGIPLEEQDQLFKPFFRAKNVGVVSGTGLGLTIVQRVAVIHGGRVDFTSEPGRTCFTLTIPRTPPPPRALSSESSTSPLR